MTVYAATASLRPGTRAKQELAIITQDPLGGATVDRPGLLLV